MRSVVPAIAAVALWAALGGVASGESAARPRGPARAPASAASLANPYAGDADAARAGAKLYGVHCARCHDHGSGRRAVAPAIPSEATMGQPGALFWFLTNGDLRQGMPSWSRLPAARRWQIVTFLDSP
jgi:mono/diheme cytochrome c family protein